MGCQDDVMTWKGFLHFWPYLYCGYVAHWCFLCCQPKPNSFWWFKTPWRSYDITAIVLGNRYIRLVPYAVCHCCDENLAFYVVSVIKNRNIWVKNCIKNLLNNTSYHVTWHFLTQYALVKVFNVAKMLLFSNASIKVFINTHFLNVCYWSSRCKSTMCFKSGQENNVPLRWRHNGRDSVSNHQPHDCLLNRLFGRRSKKTSKLCVTGLCAGNSPGTGEFPPQMASSAGNVSIWWRHHAFSCRYQSFLRRYRNDDW